jgi:hypothetical protein
MTDNLLFQSIHIPKTAGTTFWFILMDMGIKPPEILLDNVLLRPSYPKIEPQHKVIHGHFPYWRWDHKLPNLTKISWVRHPAERFLSHYLFWMKNANEESPEIARKLKAETISLEDFIEIMGNYMTNMYIPLDRLGEYSFIGLYEELDLCLQDFYDKYNNGKWVEPQYKYKNIDKEKEYYDIPLKIRRKIEKYNQNDYRLYRIVEERWIS